MPLCFQTCKLCKAQVHILVEIEKHWVCSKCYNKKMCLNVPSSKGF